MLSDQQRGRKCSELPSATNANAWYESFEELFRWKMRFQVWMILRSARGPRPPCCRLRSRRCRRRRPCRSPRAIRCEWAVLRRTRRVRRRRREARAVSDSAWERRTGGWKVGKAAHLPGFLRVGTRGRSPGHRSFWMDVDPCRWHGGRSLSASLSCLTKAGRPF